jgi:hypothetical protein
VAKLRPEGLFWDRERTEISQSLDRRKKGRGMVHTLVIPALGSLRQEDGEFEASLGYKLSKKKKKQE